MEKLLGQHGATQPRLRVQAAGFVARCPRCEAENFTESGTPELLTCDSCGHPIHRAALLHQIAASARLTAEVLVEQSRHFPPAAN